MKEIYIIEQMVNLIHAPVRIYDEYDQLVKKFDSIAKNDSGFFPDKETIHRMSSAAREEYPVIWTQEDDFVFAVLENGEQSKKTIIVGPVVLGPVDKEYICHLQKKYRLSKKENYKFSVCSLNEFISGILILFWGITGKEMNTAQIWEHNKENYKKVEEMQKRISRDFFLKQENSELHNPYEQEIRELESIQNGDVESLKKSISETYEGEIGMLAKNPLRHHKNVAIGNITLASRAAIKGGMSVEQSFSMADSLIQQVEEIKNIPEVEAFKREAQFAYARAIGEEKKSPKGLKKKEDNPLIRGVKDYIFQNMHSSIKVADIAGHFNVNADYISYLFSSHEKITIKRYIMQEKIKRSQNLLKYSDYKIQEISFYLGFSSQSHFTKIFKEITGMNPNEYRNKFGKKDKWEN